uniref:Wzx n=1 Tax=Escherichia coli TaxID=562 RepID=Q6JAB4_ECOLX|nr:Wzx [Escherichia coli]
MNNKTNELIGGMLFKGLYIFITSLNALLMVKILSPKDLGVWYVFMTLQTLIFTLNNAIIPNIARQYTLGSLSKELNFNCYIFHRSTQKTFIYLILLILIICAIATFTYLSSVLAILESQNKIVLVSWLIIVFSLCLEVYYSSYDCAFNGMGKFKNVNKINFISRACLFLISIGMIAYDIDGRNALLYFCIGYFISNLIKRFFIYRLFISNYHNLCFNSESDTESFYKKNEKIILNLSCMSFISSIGGMLIVRGGMLILPYYVSIEEVGKYGLTYQLFEIAFNLLFTASAIKTPSWIFLYKENKCELKKSYLKIKYVSLIVMAIGGGVISFYGGQILSLFGLHATLLTTNLCLLLTLIFILQLNHSISGQLLTIQNKIPYAYASLYTGIGVVLLSMIFIPITGFKGALVAIFISQLAYNNWKWPLEARKKIINV